MNAAASTTPSAPSTPSLLEEVEQASTAIDAVFERLLSDILKGHYAPGARLPAERELSRQLGASRPTLREALRRLGEWSLVEPRRGSGIVVLPYRDWTIEVLPGYLRYGKPDGKQPSMTQILLDMLGMRRAIVGEVVRQVAPRVPKGGTAPARLAMARAWSMRDAAAYPREDFEVLRTVVEAAAFTPGLWLLNRLADIYLDVASTLRFAIQAPPDYVPVHTKFFDLLEAGEATQASDIMTDYLQRHDAVITAMLKGAA
ncbi:MAG TPA: GntR family transcriptional regulator [Kofleriaceae bacterium]|jgi:DNA-binding FadR family transcriptional regulator